MANQFDDYRDYDNDDYMDDLQLYEEWYEDEGNRDEEYVDLRDYMFFNEEDIPF
jgi:hypothetical protein